MTTRYVYEYEQVTLDNMEEDLQKKVTELERKIMEVEDAIRRMEKQGIVVTGTWDGTNIPITIQGVRRKIATATP